MINDRFSEASSTYQRELRDTAAELIVNEGIPPLEAMDKARRIMKDRATVRRMQSALPSEVTHG